VPGLSDPRARIRFAFFSFLVLYNSLLVYQSLKTNDVDFRVFYTTGQLITEGRGRAIYSIEPQAVLQQEIHEGETLQFNHPAFEGLLFAPFALLPFRVALLAWILVNIGLVALACLVLRRNWIVCLSFAPVAFSLMLGQDALLLLAILALSLRLLDGNREDLAGAVLALGLFRFHVILPIAALLALRQGRRFSVGFVAGGVFVLVLSVAVTGFEGAREYVLMMTALAEGAGSNNVLVTNMTTIRGLAELLVGKWARFGSVTVVIAWLAACGAVLWKGWTPLRQDKRIAIALGLLLAPYGYAYELAPVALIVKNDVRWPFLILAFTPIYLLLGQVAAVSLMTIPLAALIAGNDHGSTPPPAKAFL
jgi:hypothetical protein